MIRTGVLAALVWAATGSSTECVTDERCRDLAALVHGRCTVHARAWATSAMPERVQVPLKRGGYRIWVLNTGNAGDASAAGRLEVSVGP
jgi:hypothetical protein